MRYSSNRLESSVKNTLPSQLLKAMGLNSDGSFKTSDFGMRVIMACCHDDGILRDDHTLHTIVYNMCAKEGQRFHTKYGIPLGGEKFQESQDHLCSYSFC